MDMEDIKTVKNKNHLYIDFKRKEHYIYFVEYKFIKSSNNLNYPKVFVKKSTNRIM